MVEPVLSDTGERCEVPGVYRSSCVCAHEITVDEWVTFPPCPVCQRPVTWTLVRALASR